MNAPAKNGALAAQAQVIAIDPAHIFIGERIGFFYPDKAAALGGLIAADGQRDPIKVTRVFPSKTPDECLAEGNQPWRLVVGRHRLEGCKLEGLNVLAIVVKGSPDELAAMEASENVHRRVIAPLERAKFTAALAKVVRARLARELGENLSDQEMGIKARWLRAKSGENGLLDYQNAADEEAQHTRVTMTRLYGWRGSVADALDVSEATVKRGILLYRQIIEPFPELAEPLAMHPIVGENAKQLLMIAGQNVEKDRRAVIEALIADATLTADAAIERFGETARCAPVRETYPHEKQWNAVHNNWKNMGLAYKRQYLPKLLSMLPAELKREARDLLNQEIGDA